MTLLKPTLQVNWLGVFRDKGLVFATSFHKGVNIVRGHNSSGKTTVLDFLAYSLGAEYIPWKPPALYATHTVVEIELNGRAVTLYREVSDRPMNPIQIFWGPSDSALRASAHDWEIYPFRRSSSKISFTQALLLALDLPESMGDGASNLTMHQFLRVLYADQPSLHSPIFRVDSFDNALTRETVGSYLCGIYNDDLYAAQLQKRDIEKAIDRLDSELKSIYSVLGRSGQGVNLEWLGQRVISATTEKETLSSELSRLKNERTVQTGASKEHDRSAELRRALNSVKSKYSSAVDRLTRYELEIEDSRKFIAELEARLANLDESKVTRNYFGSLAFGFCPSCLSEVKAPEPEQGHCSLCKSAVNDQAADAQVLRMQNELSIQRRESMALLSAREEELRKLRLELPALKRDLTSLEQQYAQSANVWSTELETAIEGAARRVGELEQEIKHLLDLQRLASTIAELQEERRQLIFQYETLEGKIASLIYSQEMRKVETSAEIAETLTRLLREDLPRQNEFIEAENIQFSFVDNQVAVNGSTQFSESSTVVLRHLFHLALLSTSTRKEFMRLPRFLILDGIEDGGMELQRSHRLQEIIVEECKKFTCDYQLIFATSQIAPQLEVDELVVGRSFSEDQKSLEFR